MPWPYIEMNKIRVYVNIKLIITVTASASHVYRPSISPCNARVTIIDYNSTGIIMTSKQLLCWSKNVNNKKLLFSF